MVLYLLLTGFDGVLSFVVSLIPSFSLPDSITNNLADVFVRIGGFNYYLPIFETLGVLGFILSFALAYKIIKVVLGVVHIDMNK